MHSWGSEGIILKRRDFGEADRIITIFTKKRGKIKALAKGVRKITSRRAPSLELLNNSKLFFSETKSWPLLTEAEVLESYPNLKEDLHRISLAFSATELIDNLFAEEQESRPTFELLEALLGQINSSAELEQARLINAAFGIKLLELAGYRPQFSLCAQCLEPLLEETNWLSPDLGGLLNSSCARNSVSSRAVSPDVVKTLRFLQREVWGKIGRLAIKESLQKEIDQILSFYLEYLLEKSLASKRFLTQVESL